jgi:spermidine/putrescine transport system permease protein
VGNIYKGKVIRVLPGMQAAFVDIGLEKAAFLYVADVLGGARNLLVGNIIKNQFLDARDWPFGAAASVLLTAAMAVLLFSYQLARRRLGARGVS